MPPDQSQTEASCPEARLQRSPAAISHVIAAAVEQDPHVQSNTDARNSTSTATLDTGI